LSISSSAYVAGDLDVGGTFSVNGNMTVAPGYNLTIGGTGGAELSYALDILNLSKTLSISSSAYVAGDLDVDGTLSAGTFSPNDLSVANTATTQYLTVTDISTFNGLITATGGLTIGTGTGIKLEFGNIGSPISTDGLIVNGHTIVTGDLNVRGTTHHDGSADLAEIYPSNEILEPGDVVIISDIRDGYIERSRTANDTKVAGVISTDPGIVLNSGEKGYKLALVGKVPVKVNNEGGNIRRGDLLVASSTPGYAMKAADPKPGTIIGKAMENSSGARGKIMALVNLQ
jgi:hypothetical protein